MGPILGNALGPLMKAMLWIGPKPKNRTYYALKYPCLLKESEVLLKTLLGVA